MKIRYKLLRFLAILFVSHQQAVGAYIFQAVESDGDVVISSSGGTVNVDSLVVMVVGGISPQLIPTAGWLVAGRNSASAFEGYSPLDSNPAFGTGSLSPPTTSTFTVAIGVRGNFGEVVVPFEYTSGSPIPGGEMRFSNQTYESLGIFPGEYRWQWGTGGSEDFIGLNVVSVPEPSAHLLCVATASLFLRRNRKVSGLC